MGIDKETAVWLFNFTVNEPITWLGYSLDNQANITIDGDFVPRELTIGNHNMMFYARDTSGNTGFQKVGFDVESPTTLGFFMDGLALTPTPTPTVPEFSWLMILPLFLSLFFIVVLFRKRKLGDSYD
jgi:hypothetical protein